MNHDSEQLAAANRDRRGDGLWLAESSRFDVFFMDSYSETVDIMQLLGGSDADAPQAVENALTLVRMSGRDDVPAPFLDALSLAFLLRGWRWDRMLTDQWNALSPRPAPPPALDPGRRFDTHGWLDQRVTAMDDAQQRLVQQIYGPMRPRRIVALLEAPAVRVGAELARCWEPLPSPHRAGRDWSAHDLG
ncbi:hypothetical protein [Dactylosporangium sucinum]|nr:hypothetical protein [Dactylosporangium sucinum]